MSNRTDFHALVRELRSIHPMSDECADRVETELHDAFVAGKEGGECGCQWCGVERFSEEEEDS